MSDLLNLILQAQWYFYGFCALIAVFMVIWSAANDKPDKDDDYE